MEILPACVLIWAPHACNAHGDQKRVVSDEPPCECWELSPVKEPQGLQPLSHLSSPCLIPSCVSILRERLMPVQNSKVLEMKAILVIQEE